MQINESESRDVLAKQLISAWEELESKKNAFAAQWDDCASYCLPEHGSVTGDRNEGAEERKPASSAGIRSASILASGLFSNTVSMGQEWFTLRALPEDLNKNDATKRWLNDAGDVALKALQNSNFSNAFHEMLSQYVVFGTGVIYSELDADTGELIFHEYPIECCAISENYKGQVDTIFREFKFTAKQAVQKFKEENGDSLNEEVLDAAKDPKRAHETFQFIHCVFEREDYDANTKVASQKKYSSIYVDVSNKHICRVSGYDLFPYQTPRFMKMTNETYGRSPAMQALPDLRLLSRMVWDWINANEYAILPPCLISDEDQIDAEKVLPGTFIPYRHTASSPPPQWMPTRADFSGFVDLYSETKGAIDGLFFVDLFLMLEGKIQGRQMTATEIVERVNEKIQNITPVVSRLQEEFFSPLVERVVYLLKLAGKLPPEPDELRGQNYVVSYTTRLDSRLAQTEVKNLRQALAELAEIVQAVSMLPDLGALFDLEKIARYIADAHNVPTDLIRTAGEFKKIKQAQAQAQAQMLAQEQAQQAIKPIDPQKAPESGSPLEQMAGRTYG